MTKARPQAEFRADLLLRWFRGPTSVEGRLKSWRGPLPAVGYTLCVQVTRVEGEPVTTERLVWLQSPGPDAPAAAIEEVTET